MKALDIFSGAGGMSIGATYAGIEISCAIARDQDAAETYARNFEHPMLCADVRAVKLSTFRDQVDLVFGGPPCQPFSRRSSKSKGKDDLRNMLPAFLDALVQVDPASFIMENVPALLGARHRQYLTRILETCEWLGYHVSYGVLAAKDFGVSTKRRRLFIIGNKEKPVALPKPTAKAPPAGGLLLDHVKDPGPAVVYAKNPVLRKSVQGALLVNGNGKVIPEDGYCQAIVCSSGNGRHIVDPSGVLQTYLDQLKAGGPARTGRVPFVRRILFEEALRFQGLAAGFAFSGSDASRWRQVGNAVPPQMAEAVFTALREA